MDDNKKRICVRCPGGTSEGSVRRYEARHRLLGLCISCPLPSFRAARCEYHYRAMLERQRAAAAARKPKPKRPESMNDDAIWHRTLVSCGLCVRCRSPLAERDSWRCADCAARHYADTRARRHRERDRAAELLRAHPGQTIRIRTCTTSRGAAIYAAFRRKEWGILYDVTTDGCDAYGRYVGQP